MQGTGNDDAEFFEGALERVQRELGDGGADSPDPEEQLFEPGFEKLEELGAGGSGRVWRARDRALDKEVALKVLDVPVLTREKRERFLREARILASLDHPNIVRIFSIDEQAGEIRLSLELVQGRTLETLVRERGPLSAAEAAQVGIDLCLALAAIHAKDLIHGDVKHSNVMRAEGGRIVLLDFGLSRGARRNDPEEAARPARGGTPLFMAPELFRGENGDARSDLFSLGVLLYWLVSGHYPFELGESGCLHSPGRTIPLRDRRADLPSEFVRIVTRLTSAAPEDRFLSAGEVETELMAFLEREARALPRRRRNVLAGVVVLCGLALVGFSTFWKPWQVFSGKDERIRLIALRAGGPVVLEDLDPVLQHERMQLELRPERDCYSYLLNEDLQGNVSVLFPDPACELQNPLRSGETYVLPGECAEKNPYYRYSISSGGRDRLLLVESPVPVPWIEEEVVHASGAAASLTAATLGEDLARGIEIERPSREESISGSSSDPFPFLSYVQGRLTDPAVHTWTRELVTR